MNKSQRIYLGTGNTTNVGSDMYIKVQLQQDIDTIEFLSMNIDAKDAYQDFNADYGVLVGRVIANGGVGIPNAKISIFIPLDNNDASDEDIISIYPYTTPRDKNADGKRYNLLPRVAKIDPNTSISSPKQPFGSFPIKEEIVTNSDFLGVYKKYYKYTALTNSAGDYMIFGVPIGTQTVHMSIDITDIGQYSMTPAAMVTNLGYSPNLFTDNNAKIKPSTDLDDLPNIETQEIAVDIIPFWGDTTNFTIGITRQDFRIRATLVNTFTIFGSSFTDGDNAMWGENHNGHEVSDLFYAKDDANITVGMSSKRIGIISEQIYYYPPSITDANIDADNVDPTKDMLLLDKTEYSTYKRDGDFVLIISCNRNKIITDEQGNQIPVDYTSANGVFTEFRGFVIFNIDSTAIPMNFTGDIGNKTTLTPFRIKLKIPQHASITESFGVPSSGNADLNTPNTIAWRKQHFKFQANKFYSVSRFHPTSFFSSNYDTNNDNTYFFSNGSVNAPYSLQPFWNSGIILTGDYDEYVNSTAQFPNNTITDAGTPSFGSNWINFSIYFPQIGYLSNGYAYVDYVRSTDLYQREYASGSPGGHDDHNNGFYYSDNVQPIAASQFNTVWMARSDIHWTDFIEVPITDIKKISTVTSKGFNSTQLSGYTLQGKYHNGTYTPAGWSAPCPFAYNNSTIYQAGKINGNPLQGADPKTYFYKGFKTADCIEFLTELGLIT